MAVGGLALAGFALLGMGLVARRASEPGHRRRHSSF
jgi:hypothetical protein